VEIRTRVKNGLQHVALNQGVQRKRKLWSKAGQQVLSELPLQPWAARRRQDLLGLLKKLDEQIAPLDQAVAEAAEQDCQARLLMSQRGVGPITALAFVLTLGDVSRFPRGKQVASYLGLIPREHSSAGRQKLGAITKQGNRMMRIWWRRRTRRSGTTRSFDESICTAATRGRSRWPRWRRRASWR